MADVVIVGAGPTGAALAFLLVKRGIPVTLVEATKEFRRVFRGEALMPSGLDALSQMGLDTLLPNVPRRSLTAWEFIFNQRLIFRAEEPMGASRPCTLISQPPLLEAIIAAAQAYPTFRWIQGIAVSDLIWEGDRVSGVELRNGEKLPAALVIGTDGRASVVRQRAGLALHQQPHPIDVLWFKLPAHDRFLTDNAFCTILGGRSGFSIFHGAEPGKLHLAWVLPHDAKPQPSQEAEHWAQTFAALSPAWLAEHFSQQSAKIESPIRLSVTVGRCPRWYHNGVLLLGDAAHPMSPVRAQGINLALRDVVVAANHLVPCLSNAPSPEKIDATLPAIQAEREPEVILSQRLQRQEARQGELMIHSPQVRSLVAYLSPWMGKPLRHSWMQRQRYLRHGKAEVQLLV